MSLPDDFDWRLDPAQLTIDMLRQETSFATIEHAEFTRTPSPAVRIMRFQSWGWFKSEFQDGDRLHHYSSVWCDGTFCSGTEGLAIVRHGEIVSAFVLSVWD